MIHDIQYPSSTIYHRSQKQHVVEYLKYYYKNSRYIKVLKKDNDTVAKAAVTLVENMKDWNPGKQRGKNVSVDYVIPVDFK